MPSYRFEIKGGAVDEEIVVMSSNEQEAIAQASRYRDKEYGMYTAPPSVQLKSQVKTFIKTDW
jgi:hypothetical protein